MKAWLQFFRVGLLPTAWSNALLGAFLNNLLDDLRWSRVVLLLGTTTALYLFGMGLNDFRDRKRDETLHPERPLPSGAIAPGLAAVILLLLLALAVSLATALGTGALAWCGAIVACILLYDLLLKDVVVFGPVAMGGVRAALVCFGGASVHAQLPHPQDPVLIAAGLVGLYVCLLTHYSTEEEEARVDYLHRRGRAVFFLTLVGLCTLQVWRVGPWWTSFLGICAWCFWTHGVALRPLRETPIRAGRVTFGLLIGLPVLDLAILLTYHLVVPAALSAVFWGAISYKLIRFKPISSKRLGTKSSKSRRDS